jgi:aldehyde:ferredoxin oxidoreductase
MGDKGVKAIAVRGTKDVNLARGAEFLQHVKDITEYIHYRNNNPLPGVMTILSGIGSPQEMKHTDEKWHTESEHNSGCGNYHPDHSHGQVV